MLLPGLTSLLLQLISLGENSLCYRGQCVRSCSENRARLGEQSFLFHHSLEGRLTGREYDPLNSVLQPVSLLYPEKAQLSCPFTMGSSTCFYIPSRDGYHSDL